MRAIGRPRPVPLALARAGAAARERLEDVIDFLLQDARPGVLDFKRRHLARTANA
jgi:hypothetical protein